MRVVKQRLVEMLPDARVFLDVDDLEEIGDLEGYIKGSSVVLVFCSEGYCASKNCMRELRSGVTNGTPLIALIEEAGKNFGIAEFRAALLAADDKYEAWGFLDEPRGAALCDALFAREPIEWNRLGVFQDVTMRLIAERLLPQDHAPTHVQGEMAAGGSEESKVGDGLLGEGCALKLVQLEFKGEGNPERPSIRLGAAGSLRHLDLETGELIGGVGRLKAVGKMMRRVLRLRSAPEGAHGASSGARARTAVERLYVSPHNEGALELAEEHGGLAVAREERQIAGCKRFLLYLDGRTWTSGARSEALAHEVVLAMRAGVKVVLAHEMPGVGQTKRGVQFGTFFACPEGATPPHLQKAGLYNSIAVPLKGGPWRGAGLVLLRRELVKPVGDCDPVLVYGPGELRPVALEKGVPSEGGADGDAGRRRRISRLEGGGLGGVLEGKGPTPGGLEGKVELVTEAV